MINKNNLFSIGIGTWGVGGLVEKDDSVDADQQVAAMAHMLNSGMNLVEVNLWYSQGYSAQLFAKALKKSDKTRDDLFICQAVYLKDYGLDKAEAEIDAALKLFDTDHIDTLQFTQSCFLKYSFEEITEFVESMLSKSKTRFTSITNEDLPLLKKYHGHFGKRLFSHEVVLNFEIRANIELGMVPYAKQHDILTVLYQPLRRNRTALRNWPLLVRLSKKYAVTQNQIIMAWHVANGYLPLTKSQTISHIDEHLKALDIKLDPADIKALNDFTPPGYTTPAIDWDKSTDGARIDQLSNTFDEEYDQALKK